MVFRGLSFCPETPYTRRERSPLLAPWTFQLAMFYVFFCCSSW
jgi:hypothetical protein